MSLFQSYEGKFDDMIKNHEDTKHLKDFYDVRFECEEVFQLLSLLNERLSDPNARIGDRLMYLPIHEKLGDLIKKPDGRKDC